MPSSVATPEHPTEYPREPKKPAGPKPGDEPAVPKPASQILQRDKSAV